MSLPVLNFPNIDVRFKKNEKDTLQIFDIVRKKFVDLTPEEWVRQHIIHFFITHQEIPATLLSVEKQLTLNNTKRRTDIVVYTPNLQPLLIVECKAPDVEINQDTINQAMRYNLKLQVPFVFLSNGLQHVFLKINGESAEITKKIPNLYEMLKTFTQ